MTDFDNDTLKPNFIVPDIYNINYMRDSALLHYAAVLAKSVTETINKDINNSILKTGCWECYDALKNVPDSFTDPPTIFTLRRKFIFDNKYYDTEYDSIVINKNDKFENIIKDSKEDEQFAIRELIKFFIIGALKYFIKNNGDKLPYEEDIKKFFPVQYYIYTEFLNLINMYISKEYKVQIKDEKKINYPPGDAINIISISVK